MPHLQPEFGPREPAEQVQSLLTVKQARRLGRTLIRLALFSQFERRPRQVLHLASPLPPNCFPQNDSLPALQLPELALSLSRSRDLLDSRLSFREPSGVSLAGAIASLVALAQVASILLLELGL
jgi:hypothetical protein